ncbi:MAG: hypothetical protein AB1806_20080 [Acidobacteriota bacterium]
MVACLFVPPSSTAGVRAGDASRLIDVARRCSPRVEARAANLVILELEGLERMFGDLEALGARVCQAARDAGFAPVHVAVAGTRAAAMLLAVARPGVTIVPADAATETLAALPLRTLLVFAPDGSAQALAVFARWGLRTLGQLAALPAADLSARVGQAGLLWQRLARGEDACPLVPVVDEKPFEATHELEWPVESLEPLSFVLGRLLEPLCQRLERRDRAAAVLSLHLRLVTRETYTRSLELPAPLREPKVLRTLLLLDLESHPVPAGIDAITVAIEPTPGHIIQESLLERALPAPEQVSTLLARLGALMGDRRCGSPRPVNSHRPGAFAMAPFRVVEDARTVAPVGETGVRVRASVDLSRRDDSRAFVPGGTRIPDPRSPISVVALRRFRLPIPARVLIDSGRPISVRTERQGLQGGRVLAWGGPWRTSGEWWQVGSAGGTSELDRLRGRAGWDRDEWEVVLGDGGIYRVFEDRESGRWFVEGIVD